MRSAYICFYGHCSQLAHISHLNLDGVCLIQRPMHPTYLGRLFLVLDDFFLATGYKGHKIINFIVAAGSDMSRADA